MLYAVGMYPGTWMQQAAYLQIKSMEVRRRKLIEEMTDNIDAALELEPVMNFFRREVEEMNVRDEREIIWDMINSVNK